MHVLNILYISRLFKPIMRSATAGKFIITKLEHELPSHLCYHNAAHTRDVHAAAQRLAEGENITPPQTDLLLAAAWYHDSGFLITNEGHEEQSCRQATEHLPAAGYNVDEIETICHIINATRVPQSPQDHLGEIIADADLDYLGRDDFFNISDKLYNELLQTEKVKTRDEWDRMQIDFMQQHQYFTKTAINTRQAQKELNLAAIKARLHTT